MRAAQADRANGLFFFPSRRGASIATPIWDITDWGVNASTWGNWVLEADYPIWGIPADVGTTLVQEMGIYSSNVSNSPFAPELAREYPPENAVRLAGRVTLNASRDTSPVLARLWVFAVLILAILVVVTGLTSLIMHLNQIRLRRDLRRRIGNGQVDLEILGIKRQKVPQKLLDKMPLYVYTSKLAPITPSRKEETPTSPQTFTPAQRKNFPKRDVPFAQTTCPICLDDFEHNDTIVRELPCQHIFHPECVDEFLRTNSSLCPMCKKSALPVGYCPENITMVMVRRERALRRRRTAGSPPLSRILPASVQRFLPDRLLQARLRPRQGAERAAHSRSNPLGLDAATSSQPPQPTSTINTPTSASSTADTTAPTPPPPPRTSTQPTPSQPDLEMGILTPPAHSHSHPNPLPEVAVPPEIQALSPEERREWGRQRLAATLPSAEVNSGGVSEEAGQVAQVGRLKRGWRKLFPS